MCNIIGGNKKKCKRKSKRKSKKNQNVNLKKNNYSTFIVEF